MLIIKWAYYHGQVPVRGSREKNFLTTLCRGDQGTVAHGAQ